MYGVSACMIVRDEAVMLPDCLLSLLPWVNEICVLDTGSVDQTREIALAHGAKVESMVWQDDFSLARNRSLAMASQPWILVIDADERLDAATGEQLKRALLSPDKLAFLVVRDDVTTDGPPERTALPRLFRRHSQVRFSRPVHESVMESLFALGAAELSESGVRLVHLGYLPEVLKSRDKHGRNLAILQRRFVDAPEDLYNAYKLAVTLPARASLEKLRVFAQAERLVLGLSADQRDELPFLPRLCDAHAAARADAGELTAATLVADRGLLFFPESPDLLSRRGELSRRAGDLARAHDWVLEAYRRTSLLRSRARERASTASAVRADRPQELRVRCWRSLFGIAELGGPVAFPPRDGAAAHLSVRCAEIRFDLRRGQVARATSALAPLLESSFDQDDVRLCAGELSWALGDVATAEAMWRLTQDSSEGGQRARVWLFMLSLARGQSAALPAVREVSDAALAQLGARSSGRTLVLDSAFGADALRTQTARWEAELRRVKR